jgi:hypothetical protein
MQTTQWVLGGTRASRKTLKVMAYGAHGVQRGPQPRAGPSTRILNAFPKEATMATLGRSSDATQWFRVIEDALWNLEHGYQLGALATLRDAVQQERRRRAAQPRVMPDG